ncbi:AAA family ATPase [Natranaerobius thermophilus JW/NM-WN-LF]|uniref:ATPase associated with various cellular activities AAA_5 n=1 Tax=Natranaerobius thermophilus (strain ATCC BAA-1301 / DSM 18059 / JW/NM-WN-LF) TaxID=457570 RepID=B2A7U3_NATTJ|nr:ATPase associated with various cellular activities AAA_5 [Natranaerobius thermophilus JW/NM-WN-LF]
MNPLKYKRKVQNINNVVLPKLVGNYQYNVYFKGYNKSKEDFIEENPEYGGGSGHPGVDLDKFSNDLANLLNADGDSFQEAYIQFSKHIGVGKAIISGYLHLYDPNKFPLINGASISGIEKYIGKQDHLALKNYAEKERKRQNITQPINNSDFRNYLAYYNLLKELLTLEELKNYHYVDAFLWYVSKYGKPDASDVTVPTGAITEVVEEQDGEAPFEQSISNLTEEISFEQDVTEEILNLLKLKKNVVFYGPPGTGKTYVAKKIANYLVGGQSKNIKFIQFHQNYSYEDFIEGIRPESKKVNGTHIIDYPIRPGVFKTLCDNAKENPEEKYVLIIDEFNRGNISKIFGELLYSLEYRSEDNSIQLPYSKEKELFYIPDNLYIIATMNTADKSLTRIDFAMRRRFAFYKFNVDTKILINWGEKQGLVMDSLATLIEDVNNEIGDENFFIGISFFMREDLPETIKYIWKSEIYPYLEEYFIDDMNSNIDKFKWENVKHRLKELIE